MRKVIKLNFLINIGDFINLFPEYLLDCIKELDIYELEINENSAYYFGTEEELKKLLDIFYFTKIVDSEENVTDLFYKYGIHFDDEVEKEYLDNYLLDKMEVNDILDKLNKYGFETMTDLDRKILDKVND